MKKRPTSSQKPSASTSAYSTPTQQSLPGIERARYVLDHQAAGFVTPELVAWLAVVTPAAAGALALVLRWFA